MDIFDLPHIAANVDKKTGRIIDFAWNGVDDPG